MSQKARVLAALRSRGTHGITAVDFDLPNVIDGGKPIQRVAARIGELEEDGHVISREGRRNKCVVYRLLRDLQDAPALDSRPRPVVGLGDRLFAPPPRNAVFDDEDAA